jgi:hypothetical protein
MPLLQELRSGLSLLLQDHHACWAVVITFLTISIYPARHIFLKGPLKKMFGRGDMEDRIDEGGR